MNKTYRNIIVGVLVAGLILGGLGLFLKYGVFQGMMTSKQARTNTQCLTQERIFDEANVLTDAQEESLFELLSEKEQMTGMDIVLLTIREPDINDYYEIRDYAQSYYEENKFGWDQPNGDGVIYVDNWATGYCWLCTTGKASEKLDDGTIQFIINRTNETINEDPYGAYRTMIDTVSSEMQNLNLFHFRIGNFWLLLIALIVAAVFAACNLIGNKGKVTTSRSTYVPDGGVKINRHQDIFLRSHVTRTKIETDHDSGGNGGGGSIGGTGGPGGGGGRH